MICQNCNAQVDDDLIFCTNCGERQVVPTEQTVLMNESVVTKVANAKPPKSSSNLKWLALIVALFTGVVVRNRRWSWVMVAGVYLVFAAVAFGRSAPPGNASRRIVRCTVPHCLRNGPVL